MSQRSSVEKEAPVEAGALRRVEPFQHETVRVSVAGAAPVDYPRGIPVARLAPQQGVNGSGPVAALVNNDVSSLSYPLSVDCDVRFLSMADPHGWRVYRRSLAFLLAKAVQETFPEARFSVEHSFGPGLYCSFQAKPAAPEGLSAEQLRAVEATMRRLIEADLPITRRKLSYTQAVNRFEQTGQTEKLNLLRFRNPPHVVVHYCDGFSDVAHGPLAPRTGMLGLFQLIRYPPGFVLHLPDRDQPDAIAPFEDQPHLFNIFQEHREWGRILKVNTAGRLNELIAAGAHKELVLTAEALHEKKVARIADSISARRGVVRIVLIAGPSSSGKTTFAKRLALQLRVNGIGTVTLSTDDYFVGLDRNPKDADGKPDFEHLEAVDVELFNRDMDALAAGREIDVPRYNFETKSREYTGAKLRLETDQILIIEGIHGLNPRLSAMIPAERKFKIYVSALTQLRVDSNNRISTTDNRLMRRMVRDRRFRGHSALETLRLWPNVRRGEKRWIFPFQREANATFNSALDYELAVLKPLVEPLLMEIKPSHPEYAEARRLSEFLLNFLPVDTNDVPRTSILREYVGGSSFQY